MKVLIACEESQRVCIAFRERGHEAYSCDIQECSGGHPEWHIQGDVLPIINGNCEFETADGQKHRIDGKWDLLIAHRHARIWLLAARDGFRRSRKTFASRKRVCSLCKWLLLIATGSRWRTLLASCPAFTESPNKLSSLINLAIMSEKQLACGSKACRLLFLPMS